MPIEDIQTNLRLPSNLKERLQESADAAGRSLSAEAAHRLSLSYELEQETANLNAALKALQHHHQSTLNSVDGLNSKLRARERDVAKLEQQLETIKEARQADIDGATQSLQKQLAHAEERIASATSDAADGRETFRMMQLTANVMIVYLREMVAAMEQGQPAREGVVKFAKLMGDVADTDMMAAAEVARDAIVKKFGKNFPRHDEGHPVISPAKRVSQPGKRRLNLKTPKK